MQAALQEAHDQNQRLTLTVSAMRSDMELMQHHATSPGPQSNPFQAPPPSSSPPFPPLHVQPQPSYQMLPQHQPQYHGSSTNSGDQHQLQPSLHVYEHQQQQEEEVQLLRQQLRDAKAEAEGLAAENERLMEMSNALRSECDRSAASQQQHVIAVANSGSQGSVPQQPCISLPSAPGLQPQQVYYQAQQTYPLGPQSMPPLGPQSIPPLGPQSMPLGQLLPHTVHWATQGMPQQPYHGFSQQPQMPQALMPTQGESSSGQSGHSVQQPQQPAGQFAAPSGQHQNGLAPTPDDALPLEVPGTIA